MTQVPPPGQVDCDLEQERVAILECAKTENARQTLREFAEGAPGAWLTREAQEAIARLRRMSGEK